MPSAPLMRDMWGAWKTCQARGVSQAVAARWGRGGAPREAAVLRGSSGGDCARCCIRTGPGCRAGQAGDAQTHLPHADADGRRVEPRREAGVFPDQLVQRRAHRRRVGRAAAVQEGQQPLPRAPERQRQRRELGRRGRQRGIGRRRCVDGAAAGARQPGRRRGGEPAGLRMRRASSGSARGDVARRPPRGTACASLSMDQWTIHSCVNAQRRRPWRLLLKVDVISRVPRHLGSKMAMPTTSLQSYTTSGTATGRTRCVTGVTRRLPSHAAFRAVPTWCQQLQLGAFMLSTSETRDKRNTRASNC